MTTVDTTRHCRSIIMPLLLAISAVASAHTGHDHAATADFAAGVVHPLSGLDHLLAMVAVGLWAAMALPPGRRWMAPLAFVATMSLAALIAGLGLLHFGGSLEVLIAASVVVLGTMLALGARVAPTTGLALIAAAAFLHGTAHGLEMVADASFGAYALGFVVSTTALHGVGLAAGVRLAAARGGLLRHAGALIGLAGMVLLAARI